MGLANLVVSSCSVSGSGNHSDIIRLMICDLWVLHEGLVLSPQNQVVQSPFSPYIPALSSLI